MDSLLDLDKLAEQPRGDTPEEQLYIEAKRMIDDVRLNGEPMTMDQAWQVYNDYQKRHKLGYFK